MLKFLVRVVVLMASVGLGRWGYEKVTALPYFTLEKVELRGNLNLPQDSILGVTGLQKGRSIYEQDLEFAAWKLARYPGVVRCTVKRESFSAIGIEVDVAEPALLIAGEEVFSLSREGVVLPFNEKLPVYPLVSGRRFARARCFDRLKEPDVAYALVAHDALLAASASLGGRLSEINFPTNTSMTLYFSPDGTRVTVDKRDFDDAIRRIKALDDRGILQGPRSFDLRFGPVAVEAPPQKENPQGE